MACAVWLAAVACCPGVPACSGRSFFMCRIDLTDEGHEHVREAVAVVFRCACCLEGGAAPAAKAVQVSQVGSANMQYMQHPP